MSTRAEKPAPKPISNVHEALTLLRVIVEWLQDAAVSGDTRIEITRRDLMDSAAHLERAAAWFSAAHYADGCE